MKILALDTETTGLYPNKHDVIQIGALVRINDKIVDEVNLKCQAVRWKNVEQGALDVNGVTMEELKSFPTPKVVWKELYEFLSRNFNGEKFIFSGQNTKFDWKFMKYWWKMHSDEGAPEWDDFFKKHHLDLMTVSQSFKDHGLINVPNIKLGTITEALNIHVDGDLHDALVDIKVTDASLIEYVNRVSKLKETNPEHPVALRFDRLLVLI